MQIPDLLKLIDTALYFLPQKMNSLEARANILAIGLQESRGQHRIQIGGPARGYFQFEKPGGIRGVLVHHATRQHAITLMRRLDFDDLDNDNVEDNLVDNAYTITAFNTILAAAFARLLLYQHPKPLPGQNQIHIAWHYYLDQWRPGKPHPETWPDFYKQAWEAVKW